MIQSGDGKGPRRETVCGIDFKDRLGLRKEWRGSESDDGEMVVVLCRLWKRRSLKAMTCAYCESRQNSETVLVHRHRVDFNFQVFGM